MTITAPNALDVAAGQLVRSTRLSKGISQETLGKAIGLTFQQVQKYESGSNRISVSRLYAIADALDVDVTALMPRTMANGAPAPNPFAALGSAIGGYELDKIYSDMNPAGRASVLSCAKAIVGGQQAGAASA